VEVEVQTCTPFYWLAGKVAPHSAQLSSLYKSRGFSKHTCTDGDRACKGTDEAKRKVSRNETDADGQMAPSLPTLIVTSLLWVLTSQSCRRTSLL